MNTIVSTDTMSWIYLTLVFLSLFFVVLFFGGEIRNVNYKVTTRSKWLPLQEKTTSFFFISLFNTLFVEEFFFFLFFFFKPGQAALVDVSVQFWKSDLTVVESLWSASSICLYSTSHSFEQSAVSFDAGWTTELVTKWFDGHRASFELKKKKKVALLLVPKHSVVINSLSYSLTVLVVCARAEANPFLNVRCSVLNVLSLSLVYEKWPFFQIVSFKSISVCPSCTRIDLFRALAL